MTASEEQDQWMAIDKLREDMTQLTLNIANLTSEVNRLIESEKRRADMMQKLITSILGSTASLLIAGIAGLVVFWIKG